MGQLRRQGAIHMSNDLVQVTSLFAGFLVVREMCQRIFGNMQLVMTKSFGMISSTEPLDSHHLRDGFLGLLRIVGPDIFFIAFTIAVVATLAVMLQTKWNIKERKIEFKFLQLNPLAGIKRIFSIYGWMNTMKAVVKLAIILPIGYFALKSFSPRMIQLVHMGIPEIMAFASLSITTVFWKILYILFALAIFDYFWGKHQWLRMNRMTKDEIKDERKSVEGDEATKKKIQAKGLQRVWQRIRNTVPKADVVVTNPTHYAVALQYDRTTMSAPIVLAKGKGFLAQRIKAVAKEAGVPVLERKPLARALYGSTEVGSQIPYELFKAVAEVLAYVYKIKRPRRPLNVQQAARSRTFR